MDHHLCPGVGGGFECFYGFCTVGLVVEDSEIVFGDEGVKVGGGFGDGGTDVGGDGEVDFGGLGEVGLGLGGAVVEFIAGEEVADIVV